MVSINKHSRCVDGPRLTAAGPNERARKYIYFSISPAGRESCARSLARLLVRRCCCCYCCWLYCIAQEKKEGGTEIDSSLLFSANYDTID